MSDVPNTPVSAPWYKSPILHSLLVLFVTKTLTHYHLIDQFAPEDVSTFVDEALSVIGYVAIGVAGWARIRSPLAPVTLTQKKADTANATAVPEVATPPVAVITDPKLSDPKETPK